MNARRRKQKRELYVAKIAVCDLNVGMAPNAVTGIGSAAVTIVETLI
jgi:hypothetical protein